MKLIVACDGHEVAAFLTVLARCVALRDAEVIFAHVVDSAFEEQWHQMAGHHWFRKHPGPREHARFGEAAARAAHEILGEAMDMTAHWPTLARRPVQLHGNPERELVRLTLSEQADLLVIGQHHLELGPHALGRCARFVIDHAPCPVLVARSDDLRAAGPALLRDRLRTKPSGRPEPHTPR